MSFVSIHVGQFHFSIGINFVLQSFSSASLAREGKVGSWSYEQNHIGKSSYAVLGDI